MKRIGNSGGLLLIVVGIGVLWWNEGNNVRNLKTTSQMSKTVVDVDSKEVNPKNEGKLVATNGKLINESELTDDTFNITVKTPIMKRVVEVYQWQEETSTDDDGDTTYSYSKNWSSDLIDSSSFHNSGHDNPKEKKYEDEVLISDDVKVGAFSLSAKQINMLSTNASYTSFDEGEFSELDLVVSGKYLTNSENINSPKVGDIRISFVYNNSTDISILAVQKGSTFEDFVSKAGKTVNRVMDGIHSGAEMIDVIKNENKALKWILRVVGVIILIIAFGTILKPLSAITSYVPIVGGLVNAAVGLVSGVLGICLGLVVIALAWIRFRPVLGICLLAVVGVLMFLLISKNKKAKVNKVDPVPLDEIVEKKSEEVKDISE